MKFRSKLMALLTVLMLLVSGCVGALAEGIIEYEADYMQAADDMLKDTIMSYDDYTDYWDMAVQIEEEDFDEFYGGLSADDQTSMAEYVEELFWDSCISYTNVGPFLPAVYVGNSGTSAVTYARTLSNENAGIALVDDTSSSGTDNGIELKKSVSGPDENGKYTITLEAYVTGAKVTTETTTTVPCDIVLVLDLSKSMDQDFGSGSRLEALKDAVNAFIDATGKKYDEETADHRISIVQYNSSATVSAGWTKVDEAGVTSLTEAVDALSQSEGTNTHLGLATANEQLTTNYNYTTGKNTTRQKVVILFTDGVPGTSKNNFSESAAVTAIANAKTIKDGGATVYSVAIYDNANPETAVQTTPSNNVDKINAMLHAISSNYPNATATGSDDEDTLTVTYGAGSNAGYYLTADSPDDLNNIFQTISSNIQTGGATVTLGSETVIKDIISPYFTLPDGADADDIKLYTADYTGENTFASRVEATGVTASVSDSTISVTGFDFGEYWCGTETTNSNGSSSVVYRGKKLIIEIPIVVADGFIGGNEVPTNGTESGIYVDSSATEALENFTVPVVNVEVKEIAPILTAESVNIYYTNPLDVTSLIKDIGKYTIEGQTDTDGNLIVYTADGTRNDYVSIVYTLYDQDGTTQLATLTILKDTADIASLQWLKADGTVFDPAKELSADASYKFECVVTPVFTGTENGKTAQAVAEIDVYKPELTFKDSTVDYMSVLSLPGHYTENDYEGTVWKHGETLSTAVTMQGTEPTLTLAYTQSEDDIDATNKVISQDDIPVKVTVAVTKDAASNDITTACTFVHQACGQDAECSWSETVLDGDPAFLLHVTNIYGGLIINKTVVDGNTSDGFAPPAVDFDFSLALTGVSGKLTPTDEDGVLTFTAAETVEGVAAEGITHTFQLAHGESLSITNLPPSTGYTVTETPVNGFVSTTAITEQMETATPNVIDAGKTDTVKVTNTYNLTSLTITKTGVDTGKDPGVSFVFNVKGTDADLDVAINENGSVTIYGLTVGNTYTVTEELGNWRYSAADSDKSITLVADEAANVVTFENNRNSDKWLDGDCYAENAFN